MEARDDDILFDGDRMPGTCPTSSARPWSIIALLLLIAMMLLAGAARAAAPISADPAQGCAEGLHFFVPGSACKTASTRHFEAGCHRPCDGADDDTCPATQQCRKASIDPFPTAPHHQACSRDVWLCMKRS